MNHLSTSLYTVADQLHDIETFNLENTDYIWDGIEYDNAYQLLEESSLTNEAPEEDVYSDLVAPEIGEKVLKESDGPIEARIISDQGTTTLSLPDGDAASVFYSHQHKRGQYILDTEPDNDSETNDSKREYVMHDEPVLTIDEDNETTGILLFGREKGSAPCQYIDERFPGDLIYLETDTAIDPGTLEDLEPDQTPKTTEQNEANDTAMGENLEQMYRSQLNDQPLTYRGYVELTDELADNIRQLDRITDTMQQYFHAKAAEQGLADEQRHHEDPKTYQQTIETQLSTLKDGYSDVQEAIKFTDLGTHRALPIKPNETTANVQIDDESPLEQTWIDRLKDEHPETYTTLHDTHQLAGTSTAKPLDSVRPSLQPGPDGNEQRIDPAMMLAQIDMQGFEAVDDYIETVLEQEETWDGNETTDMMFS